MGVGKAELTVAEGVTVLDKELYIKLHLKRNAESILEVVQDAQGYELLKGKGLFDSVDIDGTECLVIKYIISMYAESNRSLADLLRLYKVINDETFKVEITGFVRDPLVNPDRDGNDILQLVGFKLTNTKNDAVTFVRMEQRYKSTGHELRAPGTATRLYGELQKSASSGTSILASQRCNDLTEVQEAGLRGYYDSVSQSQGKPLPSASA